MTHYEYTDIESISRSIERMNKNFPGVVQMIEVSLFSAIFRHLSESNLLFQRQKSALFEEFQKSVELELSKAEICNKEGYIVEEERDDAYESKLTELGFEQGGGMQTQSNDSV